MNDFATKLSEGFAKKVLKVYFESSVAPMITNTDYEGEVKNTRSKVNILTFGKMALKNYTGADLTADTPQESIAQLVTDQMKAYYFKIPSLSTFKSWIKNPEGTLIPMQGDLLAEAMDSFILGKYAYAAAENNGVANWIGTAYTTGTVEVAVTTGAVTGSGTTFTAGMVGKPFKAAGHSKYYKVKSFTNATSIVIEDDGNDDGSVYTGGAIGAGATYSIEAATKVAVTKSTIYSQVVALRGKLNKARVPKTDRFVVFPSDAEVALLSAPELIPAVPTAYGEVVKNGKVGRIAGLDVYVSEQVTGDNTSGFYCLAGHKSAITRAEGFVESDIEKLIGNFGKAYKGLTVYGAHVPDERRKALAVLFATFSAS